MRNVYKEAWEGFNLILLYCNSAVVTAGQHFEAENFHLKKNLKKKKNISQHRLHFSSETVKIANIYF